MSNRLNLSQMTSAQNQKHVTHNDANGEIDEALTGVQVYAVDDSNVVAVTLAEQQRASVFQVSEASPSPTGGISLTFPATARGLIAIWNNTAQTITVEIEGSPTQSVTPPTLAAGALHLFTHDGANIQLVT